MVNTVRDNANVQASATKWSDFDFVWRCTQLKNLFY